MLTSRAEHEREVLLSNVHDAPTADAVEKLRAAALAEHRFENWDYLTGEAKRSKQLDAWFAECKTKPGLEQLVMRSLALAHAQRWIPDGELIKKLNAKTTSTVFEVRAWYNGSNNVRILFGRNTAGTIVIGHGGIKTSPDWYLHAIPWADRIISEL